MPRRKHYERSKFKLHTQYRQTKYSYDAAGSLLFGLRLTASPSGCSGPQSLPFIASFGPTAWQQMGEICCPPSGPWVLLSSAFTIIILSIRDTKHMNTCQSDDAFMCMLVQQNYIFIFYSFCDFNFLFRFGSYGIVRCLAETGKAGCSFSFISFIVLFSSPFELKRTISVFTGLSIKTKQKM